MTYITSNSKDGSVKVTATQQSDNTSDISGDTESTSTEIINQVALPAGQQIKGNIDYFGSSFSGADIRVYANLYNDKSSVNAIIPQLEEDRDYAQEVVNAASIIENGPADVAQAIFAQSANTNSNSIKNQFLAKIGLSSPSTNAQQLASQFMLNQFFGQFNSQAKNFANIRTSAKQTIKAMQSMVNHLNSQLEALKNDQKLGGSLFYLGTLQTLSIQSHREKFGVRSLGRSYVKGYTRGPRTIAGSLIFTVFHEHAFAALMRRMATVEKEKAEISFLLPDQLPPLDLTILLSNEYGQQSQFGIYGLEILSDGVTYSIEDLLSENVMQFTCRDVDPLRSQGRVKLDRETRNIETAPQELSASSLTILNTEYTSYLERLKVRRRLLNR